MTRAKATFALFFSISISALAVYLLRFDEPRTVLSDDVGEPASEGNHALGDSGTASTAPAAVGPMLFDNAQDDIDELEDGHPNEEISRAGPRPPTSGAEVLQVWEGRGVKPLPGLREADGAFITDPVDPLWAPAMETDILNEIAQIAGLQLVSVHVECRTSACRLQWRERISPQEADRRLRSRAPHPIHARLQKRLGYEMPDNHVIVAGARDRDESLTWVLYVERPGVPIDR